MSASTDRRHFTPPEIAEEFGVAVAKVIAWIRCGELKAIDVANRGCTRPRYRIAPDDLDRFKQARAVVPEQRQPRTHTFSRLHRRRGLYRHRELPRERRSGLRDEPGLQCQRRAG